MEEFDHEKFNLRKTHFILEHVASLAWNKYATYGNATKRGQTSNKISSNKLLVDVLNKLLKTHASDVSPQFYESLLRLRVYNIRAKFSSHCRGTSKNSWAND